MTEKKEARVTEAAFLKAMNAKTAAAKEAARKERPSGLMDDSQILERLGIEPDTSKTFQANVSNIKSSFAKNDPDRPMYRFFYTIHSDNKQANGVTVSNMFILADQYNSKTKELIRSEAEILEQFMWELQGLGEDTPSYKNPLKDAMDACKRHAKDKTPVSVTIRHWVGEKSSGMNVRVNPARDNSDLDESSDDSESSSEFNPDDWIGGWIDYDFEGDDIVEAGKYPLKVISYDADSNSFNCEDESGEPWDTDNGYAVPCDDESKFEWSEKNDD